MATHWTDRLTALGACSDAVAWARDYPTAAAAWAACTRGDWMLWIMGRLAESPDSASRRRLVLAACECARLALRYVPPGETRPRIAIETAEQWAQRAGQINLADVRAAAWAAGAARAAAWAAGAAGAAGADAWAARAAGAAARAAWAAAWAAGAAWAAAWAARAAGAAGAAGADALRQCADVVRQHCPRPPRAQRGARHAN